MSSGGVSDSILHTIMRDKTLNVRVYGIPEVSWSETHDDCIQACLTAFNRSLDVPVTRDDIEIAHRFGKIGTEDRPRPIIVKFTDLNTRGHVLAAAKQRLNQNRTGISVREDLAEANYNLHNKTGKIFDQLMGGLPSTWENISYRLLRRINLIHRQRRLVNIACMLAVVGILSMLVDCELFIQRGQRDILNLALKVMTSTSTLCLVVSIMAYHVRSIQLSMVDNCFEDWRLVARAPLICCILVELVICAIHPLPVMSKYDFNNIESALAILMFLRLYLIPRYILVHSTLVTKMATRTLGALNKVRIDSLFLFKALMSNMPGTLLTALRALVFIMSTWSLRNCEANLAIYQNKTIAEVKCQTLDCAMWLSAITFLTVGYGDEVPKSECGKITAVVTGLFGMGSTVLLVAVLAQKLEQSSAEKYLHAFVRRVELDKRHKVAAANVIKNVLKLWRITHLERAATTRTGVNPNGKKDLWLAISNQYTKLHKRMFQRSRRINVYEKLLQAVRQMKEAKLQKAHLLESIVGFLDVGTSVEGVFRITETISKQQELISAQCERMENRLTSIEENLKNIVQVMLQERTDKADKREPCSAN